MAKDELNRGYAQFRESLRRDYKEATGQNWDGPCADSGRAVHPPSCVYGIGIGLMLAAGILVVVVPAAGLRNAIMIEIAPLILVGALISWLGFRRVSLKSGTL